MNKYFQPLVVLFIFVVVAGDGYRVAQAQGVVEGAQARKFDEFGDIPMTDIKARLDNFAIELQTEAATRGFIIVYRSRRDLPGLSARLTRRMRNYLVYSRAIPAERVVTVDGGVAAQLTQELWIVPPGDAPVPRTDAYPKTLVDVDSVRKFDEYAYFLPEDRIDAESDVEGGDSLEAFAAALRNEPQALAYIIVYPRYDVERREQYVGNRRTKARRIVHWDAPATPAKVLRALKAELSDRYRIAADRIRTMNGGHRRWREVEFWIVPRGQHAPVPTPNTFPPRRRKARRAR
jgi:hypothetical protein